MEACTLSTGTYQPPARSDPAFPFPEILTEESVTVFCHNVKVVHWIDSSKYLLNLKTCLGNVKQLILPWYPNLKTVLISRGFVEFLSDPNVYITKNMTVLVSEYV